MSKNISIQEGGVAKQLTVDKLKTNLVGSGTCLWVPEDEVPLGTKNITKNGTYRASDDGYYGYSQVTVNGVGTATGKDSDGDKAMVETDPITGELVIKKLPSSIAVTTPPTKLSYTDGEAINFSGMVVNAYLASGDVWSDSSHPSGVVPIAEMTLPETIADYSKADQTAHVTSEFDITPNPFVVGSLRERSAWSVGGGAYRRSDSIISSTGAIKRTGSTTYTRILASATQASVTVDNKVYYISKAEAEANHIYNEVQAALYDGGDIIQDNSRTYELSSTYTYHGETVYYTDLPTNIGTYTIWGISQDSWITSGAINEIAWSMMYDDVIESGSEEIPVQWVCPGSDGERLETSFLIHVDQSFGGATGGGGQAGEGGAGRND